MNEVGTMCTDMETELDPLCVGRRKKRCEFWPRMSSLISHQVPTIPAQPLHYQSGVPRTAGQDFLSMLDEVEARTTPLPPTFFLGGWAAGAQRRALLLSAWKKTEIRVAGCVVSKRAHVSATVGLLQ